ncbi:unnamed protein product, partial [Owenia fusiformis]
VVLHFKTYFEEENGVTVITNEPIPEKIPEFMKEIKFKANPFKMKQSEKNASMSKEIKSDETELENISNTNSTDETYLKTEEKPMYKCTICGKSSLRDPEKHLISQHVKTCLYHCL